MDIARIRRIRRILHGSCDAVSDKLIYIADEMEVPGQSGATANGENCPPKHERVIGAIGEVEKGVAPLFTGGRGCFRLDHDLDLIVCRM